MKSFKLIIRNLAIIMLIFTMFASNLQAQNVPINQTFITDIAVSINSDQQKALSGISRYGFSCVGAQTSRDDYNRIDFNQDAKGDFAYVGMKYSKDYTKAITDIICRVDGFNENSFVLNNKTYYKVRPVNDFKETDLNAGVKGSPTLNLYYTKDGNENPGNCLTYLWACASKEWTQPRCSVKGYGYGEDLSYKEGSTCDFNMGCGKTTPFIYLIKEKYIISVNINDGGYKSTQYFNTGMNIKISIPDRRESDCMYNPKWTITCKDYGYYNQEYDYTPNDYTLTKTDDGYTLQFPTASINNLYQTYENINKEWIFGNFDINIQYEIIHKYTATKTVKAVTCTSNGSIMHYCPNHPEENYTTPIKTTGHKWGEYVVTKEATETSEGVKTRYCQIYGCTETQTTTIPKKNHVCSYGEWKVETPATCVTPGEQKRYCSANKEHFQSKEIPATNVHKYGEWVESEKATCKNGMHYHVCEVCGDLEEEEIPAVGEHTIVVDKAVKPQVGIPGRTQGSHCIICGSVIEECKVIPALTEDPSDNPGDDKPGKEDNPTAIEAVPGADNAESHSVLVYPNPIKASENFNLMLKNYSEKDIAKSRIIITDINGSVVKEIKTVQELNTLSMPKGLYLINVITNSKDKMTIKIVVE